MCEIPEDGKGVPKHVAIVRDYTDKYVVCAFGWFSKRIFRREMQRINNFELKMIWFSVFNSGIVQAVTMYHAVGLIFVPVQQTMPVAQDLNNLTKSSPLSFCHRRWRHYQPDMFNIPCVQCFV